MAALELGERGLLEALCDLDLRGSELTCGALQYSRAGILSAVNTVTESHDAPTGLERVADPLLRIARGSDLVEHGFHIRWCAAVQRAGKGAHGSRQRSAAVGAGRGRHTRGEGRGV